MSTAPQTTIVDPVANVTPKPEPTLIQQERTTLHEIQRLVSARASSELDVERTRSSSDAFADQEYQKSRQALSERFADLEAENRKADEDRRRAVVDAAMAGESEAKSEFAKSSRRIAADFEAVREQARQELARNRSEAAAAADAGDRAAASKYAEARRPIDQASKIIESMRERLAIVFESYRKFGLHEPASETTKESYTSDDPVDTLFDRLGKAEAPLKLLEELLIPRAMKGYRFLWLFVIVFLIVVVPLVQSQGAVTGAGVALGLALAIGMGLRQWLYSVSKSHVSRYYYTLHQTVVDGTALAAHCMSLADGRLKTERAQVAARREQAQLQAKQKQTKTVSLGETARDDRLRQINERYAQRMVEIQTKQQMDIRAAIEANERRQADFRTQRDTSQQRLEDKYRTVKEKIRARHESSWGAMAKAWRDGMTNARTVLDEVAQGVDAIGPSWSDPSWSDRPFPRAVPSAIRFGEVRVALDQLPGGISSDARLMDGIATVYTFPALLHFPDRANTLIETPAAGRGTAISVLQAAMFRLLTSLPPGQVRFTIVDPIGIGRNFGAFMHLADFDEALVTNQIWTEPRQIEERLADLSAHMEKVTQKYLRNEYATLAEYNAVAGEVAEPYRVVVVADYPASFDEKTANRLASIAAAGAPCGVIVLAAVDLDRPLPPNVTLDELRANAVRLTWNEGTLVWDDPDLGRYPLALDAPPPSDFATPLIHRAGAAAKDAKRVIVPFEFIAPAPDAWWQLDSRAGIDVPLGKAGATKRQNLLLGQGTSQHVLVAGRTGSGKSTLMHALIVNLALNYSPDEMELCLIDFKKGVEFKVYATYQLPHASVVAIESEREFGISVLQRLDAEMAERGVRYRDAGVQDVNGYRNAPGTPPLPRILLVVDEFQEFFVEDDKLAHEAAQLLDRLVRQGRAFGIHVFLGSQSLGGAFALARSTLGQMAVRIALQCSEGDATLILSESNSAAQLLSRPGEAVYNNANGLAEGNHFFQVVWLSDERREQYLKQIHELAQTRKPILKRTPIVFEGDAPASLARNPLLAPRLEAPVWPTSPFSAQAWLGDAVAIKDPTAALFRRQGGSHLLIVGQNDQAALGIMTAAFLSLVAQYPPPESETIRSGARFAILDGTPEDHPRANYLARLGELAPHPVETGGWREAPRILAELAQELQRRQQPDAADGPEIYLFIQDLGRFRDLRRKENDFGFGRREEEASPADNLITIVKEGSGFGLHILTWCDNLNNLNRYFEHQTLREFEMRVLFQMSPNDSAHLLDAPFASKLGANRALFASEEQNQFEKFRPYGLPDDEWLDRVREQFRKRTAAVSG